MNVRCTQCEAIYRIDPRKVPARGVKARCSRCAGLIHIAGAEPVGEGVPASPAAAGAATPAEPAVMPSDSGGGRAPAAPSAPSAEVEPPAPQRPAVQGTPPQRPATGFGSSDPHARARRLARALVSDIAVYHPERRDRSLEDGTLRQEFREEIRKSWEEYAAQVGDSVARSTPYFREALNEILARGQAVF